MEILFNTFITLFLVIDPIGLVPMFAALTHGGSADYKRRMAIRGTAIAALVLLLFVWLGTQLLNALGISLAAFRIAGGALLFLLAIDMLFARHSGLRSTTVAEQAEAEQRTDVSVFPLAIPLIAGPGAMTSLLLLISAAGGDGRATTLVLGTLAVVLLITLGTLLYAPVLMRLLGETGANVVSRLLGIVLSALAVQFVVDGLHAAFPR